MNHLHRHHAGRDETAARGKRAERDSRLHRRRVQQVWSIDRHGADSVTGKPKGRPLRKRITSLLPFVVAALLVLLLPAPFSPTPVAHELTMTASQFAFDPPVLRVKQGDRVILNLQASDVVHGLYLDGYSIDARVEPGLSQRIEFVADRTGKYRYRCSVACGTLHPFMIGELVVSPNLPFVRAVGLALTAVAATLFYLWRFPPGEFKEEERSV